MLPQRAPVLTRFTRNDASRAAVRAWSVSVLLVNEIALGAAMSSRTSSPTR